MSTGVVFTTETPKLEVSYDEQNDICIILAHPHPKLGGNMGNNVVQNLRKRFKEEGYSTICFNTRGVGKSEGSCTWTGQSEIQDYQSVVRFVANKESITSIVYVGYSFSSVVGFSALNKLLSSEEEYNQLAKIKLKASVAVSYPRSMKSSCIFGKHFKFVDSTLAKLFVVGEKDSVCPLNNLRKFVESDVSEPKTFTSIKSADHFWNGQENELSEIIFQFVSKC